MSEILKDVQRGMDKSIYDDDKEKRGHLVQNSMVSTEAMLTVASVATLISRASRSGDISSPIFLAELYQR